MLDRLARLVPESGGEIDSDDYKAAFKAALVRYSTDRPCLAWLTLDGPGPHPFPDDWSERLSRVVKVRSADLFQEFDPASVKSVEGAGLAKSPALPDAVTVGYTRCHTEESLPSEDKEAVLNWAAACLLDGLANRRTGDLSTSIAADTVDHVGKGALYATRARQCRQLYWDHMGIDPKRVECAGTVVVVKPTGSSGRHSLFRRGGRGGN